VSVPSLRARPGAALASGVPAADALAPTLAQIALQAGELDAHPRFPEENFDLLKAAGVVQLAGDRATCDLTAEAALVRALAAADASTARILDGHFNGAERLALLGQEPLRGEELARIARGELLLGVWGADPAPGEGPRARVVEGAGGGLALTGVKTFCSGAGGVQRALIVARDEHDAKRIAYVDATRGLTLDRDWYRASGLRASESHRVEFDQAPVLALLGAPEEIVREPWFSRDAVRTAATWAGIADGILAATVALVGERALADELRLHAIGRMRVARSSIDRWLDYAVGVLDGAEPAGAGHAGGDALVDAASAGNGESATATRPQGTDARALAAECRLALSDAARLIAAEAARVCGSRALIGGSDLDRARRDLDLFLLQHRLDPKLVELGAELLAGRAR
jgi:alkylation response protein AidB-like acyl-CoA dehydrogenase